MNLMREMQRAAERSVEQDGRWIFFESAIVADVDDPERQHRIKVIIPSIDPDNRFDDWVRAGCGVCLGNGYGHGFIPEPGSEVLVSGVLGQKYNLVYHAPMYHEDWSMPPELDKDTAGIKVPRNLSFIAELLAKLQAQNIQIIAAELARTTGQTIESIAQQLNKLTGQNVKIEASQAAEIEGNQIKLNGATITVQGSNISIQGGSVAITGSSVTLRGRPVNPTGPPI